MNREYDVKKIFGLNLKHLREAENLTQEHLADALGMETYQTINRIENGKTFVTAAVFEKICAFFNVEPYTLLLKQNQVYKKETLDKIDEINIKINEICTLLKKTS